MTQTIDYFAIAPPVVLALVAGLVLLLDVFLPRSASVRTALGLVSLAGLAVAFGFVVAQAVAGRTMRTFCVPADLAGQGPPLCSFVVDRFTLVLAGLAILAGAVVVLLSMTELAGGGIPVGEWHFLLLCTLVGATTLPASRDLIMLVVALELVSLPVFALTALKRYDGRASEAAVKLFLVSVVSTAIMLFGVSLLYGMSGTVYLSRLGEALGGSATVGGASRLGEALGGSAAVSGQGPVADAYTSVLPVATDLPMVVTVGVVLVVAGFAFKIAAVPFHSWAGDVYQGAPIPVAALLSVVSKAAGFAGLILVLLSALPAQAQTWAPIIAIVSALTMTVGNLLAMRQRSAVRLLAWSSVAQSGYILAPLAVFTEAGQRGQAAGASVAYLVFYAAMNLGAFAVVMLVSRTSRGNELDDYRGMVFRRPVAALALAFSLICLAGLPPGLAGLFAKVVVFREIVNGGLGWLAVVMAINTVIGLYYYVVWTSRLFAPTPDQAAPAPGLAEHPAPALGPTSAEPAGAAPAAPERAGATPASASAPVEWAGPAPGHVSPERAGAVPGSVPAAERAGAVPDSAERAGAATGAIAVSAERAGHAVGPASGEPVGAAGAVPGSVERARTIVTSAGGADAHQPGGGRWTAVWVAIGVTFAVALVFSVAPQLVFAIAAL
ncbi:proton-conducting transporter membrane subunit [Nonomuraea sp. NPDC059194]|uniref:proton-conducting transporter transmembrane domain-containing protein n=1 Tax=Nonomuraea sp. NPDC059194 TaxID=3346764 RepID=UPI0036A2A469